MSRLVIVSNRLPMSITRRGGEFVLQQSAGGLATGVGSFYRSYQSLWIGWPGLVLRKSQSADQERLAGMLEGQQCHPIFLSEYDIRHYYSGFSNNTIWPLFHYLPQYVDFDHVGWSVYKRVNRQFCDAVVSVARSDDAIWIHDYQLMLLPQMIRDELPDAKIGFFLHIPFPSFEIFRLLPWRNEILEGLLGADLIGFHTYDYVRHFLSSVHRVLGYEHTLGELTVGNRLLAVDMFPMGIDYRTFSEAVFRPDVKEEVKKIRKRYGQRKVILSSDRLDYTKGIPLRLEAFEAFLEKKPESQGKVSLILVAVPSRTTIGHYQRLKEEIDGLVGRINGRFGTMDWLPVQYFNTFLPWRSLIAHYSIADVCMLTPLRDGMNLMAKEFIATKTDGSGVLILSEMAGAAQELGEAIIVNPHNRGAMVEAIESALAMPRTDQIERNRTMQRRLQRYDVEYWAGDFIQRLECVKIIQQKRSERGLTAEHLIDLLSACRRSATRLFLLDYDGTLVPFAQTPTKAAPAESLLRQLAHLASIPGNDVVIISGRDRATMDRWFGSLDIGFVAEHGVWLKERGGEWWMPEPLSGDWKSEIFPILEVYADRTPGAVIEEKEYSLVWHYRRAAPDLGSLRAKELKDDLLHLTANLNLAVIEGNKIVEVKNAIINKGRAALHWITGRSWDFVLALGDDRTDEDIFGALPDGAYTIKIGRGPSKARFNLHSPRDVLALLEGCASPSGDKLCTGESSA